MSHTAIAAVLARDDLSIGERLAALSLASYANREHRAFPGNAAAAARAGLSRSRYLEAREQLLARGLIAVEEAGRGRGQATTLTTLFAQFGPWWDADINAGLLEHVLGHSHACGAARALLATLAALADDSGVVEEINSEELCRAAGLADSTYRRARSALLASGEVELVEEGGGRGRLNRWQVRAADAIAAPPVSAPRRRRPAVPSARPLLATVRPERLGPECVADVDDDAIAAAKGPVLTGVSEQKGPIVTGVSPEKGPIVTGVSRRKGPVLTGVSDENPAKTPPETPPPNARAGTEPLNPRTRNPPNPPGGGSTERWVIIQESYLSDRGRHRRRPIRVDLDEVRRGLAVPSSEDQNVWRRIRDRLQRRVGESMFAIWLEPVELIAIDGDKRLVLAPPTATAAWIGKRFGRLLTATSSELGLEFRFANEAERHSFNTSAPNDRIQIKSKEASR